MVAALLSPPRPMELSPLTGAQRDALRALPTDIVAGLRVLRDEAAPPVTKPELWDEIAVDAIMLAADGWAGQALAFGWTPTELFGCAADPWGDDRLLGLAGRVARRRVLAITEDAAHVHHGRIGRTLPPHRDDEITLLWSYGR